MPLGLGLGLGLGTLGFRVWSLVSPRSLRAARSAASEPITATCESTWEDSSHRTTTIPCRYSIGEAAHLTQTILRNWPTTTDCSD